MTADHTIQNRGGRKSKGERRVINFRLPIEKADLAREIATAEGYEHLSDWVAMTVTEYMKKRGQCPEEGVTEGMRED